MNLYRSPVDKEAGEQEDGQQQRHLRSRSITNTYPVPTKNASMPNVPAGASGVFDNGVFGKKNNWCDSLAEEESFNPAACNPLQTISPLTNPNGRVSFHMPGASAQHQQQQQQQAASNPSSKPPSPVDPASSSNQQVKFVNSTVENLQNQIRKEEAPKKKRTRTSPEQLRILQKAFATDPMPSSAARLGLSKKLGMSARAVQVWFQNRRAKGKRFA